MKTKFKCKNCKRNFGFLTREGLCAYCYNDIHGKWSGDFQGSKDEGKKK